jgi:ABC-type glycerol-3-phosphate transport system permease component
MWGMVFVTVVMALPSMGSLLSALFRDFDPRLEEAAATSGAGRWQTPKRVAAPLMLPGILVVLVYFSIVCIEVFEVPLAIHTTAEIPVLVVTDGLSGMNSSDFDLVNSLPISAGRYAGTALHRVAGSDGWSATIPSHSAYNLAT